MKRTGWTGLSRMSSRDNNQAIAEPSRDRLIFADDEIEARLAAIWQQVLSLESIGTQDNFFDLGGDSSLAVRMFAEIEKVFKVKLPLATLYETPTIEELARVVRDDRSTSGWAPLVAIQKEGSRPPLFLFHGAGGNVLIYRGLSRHLSDQPIYGLQAQGLDGSQPPLTTVEDMAALYVKEIKKIQPYGPYFLGGYCGGGTIAYEAAQQFQVDGERVALLALFDTMNWSKIPITLWSKVTYACQRFIFHGASFLSLDIPGVSKFLTDKRKILSSRLPVWQGMLLSKFTRNAGNSALLAEIWQINDLACWRYVPKPYAGTVTDFRPFKQYGIFNKPGLKWDELARGGKHEITLPVYPASMLVEPFVKHLAEALEKSIESASSGNSR